MPFYAKLGVPEVWVIDRDTKAPELYVLEGDDYKKRPADEEGWLHSAATGVRLRAETGQKLAAELAADQSTRQLLPED